MDAKNSLKALLTIQLLLLYEGQLVTMSTQAPATASSGKLKRLINWDNSDYVNAFLI